MNKANNLSLLGKREQGKGNREQGIGNKKKIFLQILRFTLFFVIGITLKYRNKLILINHYLAVYSEN
ncbi:hypothetical protein D5R40_23005 [Okeania hirsuta]|uniref:Uncharacterized protein n=1 Tax=Okeania hirsuta TaxID=1458930 RepID=A0A3N6PMY0_9CYAN|nr:hypothetical protein D5R40_23005 [Okeania hirsuta]